MQLPIRVCRPYVRATQWGEHSLGHVWHISIYAATTGLRGEGEKAPIIHLHESILRLKNPLEIKEVDIDRCGQATAQP